MEPFRFSWDANGLLQFWRDHDEFLSLGFLEKAKPSKIGVRPK